MQTTPDEWLGVLGSPVVILAPRTDELMAFAHGLLVSRNVYCKILPPTIALSELEQVTGARILLAVPEALALVQPSGLRRLHRWRHIFILVQQEGLLPASSALDLADGVIFFDDVEPRPEILDLAIENVVVLPPYLDAAFSLDQVRLTRLRALKLDELRVLECLGQGLPNHLIGEMLGLGEPKVKAAVRRLMVNLHFRNRTHAGIFADRIGGRLAEVIVGEEAAQGPSTTGSVGGGRFFRTGEPVAE